MIRPILLFLIMFALMSCKSKVEKQVMGVWVIDEIVYKDQDIKHQLLSNAITIRKNYVCELPIINVQDIHSDKEKGMWEIKTKKAKLYFIIQSTNQLFNGEFEIKKIWKEQDPISHGEFLKMIICNEKMTIRCTRDASDLPI